MYIWVAYLYNVDREESSKLFESDDLDEVLDKVRDYEKEHDLAYGYQLTGL